MAFSRPSLDELIERAVSDIEAAIGGVDARTRRTVARALGQAVAGYAHGLYGYLDWIARQILPDSAEAEALDRHGALWQVARTPADYASGSVLATGTAGASVSKGARVRATNGAEYSVLGTVAIGGGGTAVVTVDAVAAGAAANVLAGAVLTFTTPLTGVVSTVTVQSGGLTGGADEETDDAYRARILARMADAPGGGTAADYKRWALAVAGVTRAWVRPGAGGAGTVTVYFAMDLAYANGIPQAGDVTTMQAALDAQRPVTAVVTAAAPTAKTLNLTIVGLQPLTQAVKDAVAAEVTAMLARVGQPGGTLSRSLVTQAISSAVGETSHKLTVPADDVTHAPAEIPLLGTITWA